MWVVEFAFAMVIFLLCIGLFYKSYPNIKEQNKDPFQEVYFDSKVISEILVSPGLPYNWTVSDVKRPGITDGKHKVVEDKLMDFYYLSKNNYTLLKSYMGIGSEFAFYFLNHEDDVIKVKNHKIFGNHKVNVTANGELNFSKVDEENVARIERSLLYEKKPVRLIITAWN